MQIKIRDFDWVTTQIKTFIWEVVGAYIEAPYNGGLSVFVQKSLGSGIRKMCVTTQFPETFEEEPPAPQTLQAMLKVNGGETFQAVGKHYCRLGNLGFDTRINYAWLNVRRYEAWRAKHPRAAWALDRLPAGCPERRLCINGVANFKHKPEESLWRYAEAFEWAAQHSLDGPPHRLFLQWNDAHNTSHPTLPTTALWST